MTLKLFFLFLTGCSLSLASKWSYSGSSGPLFWHDLFPDACSGRHQSPIDIQAERTIYDPDLREFAIWYDPPKPGSMMYLKNNGHTVQVDLDGEFYVTNAGLPHVYRAAQFHFHWGHKVHSGSEHTVEGSPSPIEMHLVTYNKDLYPNIGSAVTEKGGLAVLGVMFEVSGEDNPAFDGIVTALKHVRDPEIPKRISIPVMPLRDLLPSDISRYFRYNGSLTTPGCYESVTWTVFDVKQKISHKQLHEFRTLLQFKRHHKKHQKHGGGDRHRRGAKSRAESLAEEAAESVVTELGIVGDKFEESLLKEQLLEKKVESQGGNPPHSRSGDNPDTQRVPISMDEPKVTVAPTQKVEFVQDNLVNNYRPVQPLNGRIVYRSFKLREPQVVVIETAPDTVAEQSPPVYTAETRSSDQHRNAGVQTMSSVAAIVVSTIVCLFVKL